MESWEADHQDEQYGDGRRNQIVMFKSCFPNNAFRREGAAPGAPSGPELTVWNAKGVYFTLLDEFRKQPGVLFVAITAPPLAPGGKPPLWRYLARRVKATVKGETRDRLDLAQSARLAREFNAWLSDSEGWLKGYPLNNVVVFDYYDVLTDHGASDLSRYPTGGGEDSHPSSEGNTKATQAFVPFLNQSVRRAGLAE